MLLLPQHGHHGTVPSQAPETRHHTHRRISSVSRAKRYSGRRGWEGLRPSVGALEAAATKMRIVLSVLHAEPRLFRAVPQEKK
jgi:hypothetical protein